MFKVVKKKGKTVQAYRLGTENTVIETLINQGKIVPVGKGEYEVFSQEAVNAQSGHGQIAHKGDWIRVDSQGFPYPNKNEWVEQNLKHLSGDDFEQIPKPLDAWTAECEMCPEIEFLIKEKGLVLNENDPERYFYAILWGNPEAAAKDAVLIFYGITYDDNGNITDADYNFVERNEFNKNYNTEQ